VVDELELEKEKREKKSLAHGRPKDEVDEQREIAVELIENMKQRSRPKKQHSSKTEEFASTVKRAASIGLEQRRADSHRCNFNTADGIREDAAAAALKAKKPRSRSTVGTKDTEVKKSTRPSSPSPSTPSDVKSMRPRRLPPLNKNNSIPTEVGEQRKTDVSH
jgi:hypothetical protein